VVVDLLGEEGLAVSGVADMGTLDAEALEGQGLGLGEERGLVEAAHGTRRRVDGLGGARHQA
jgi:hypothetical protein